MPPSELATIHAPLGLEIGATTPEEIAVSVLAEMIAVRRGVDPVGDPPHEDGAARPPQGRTVAGAGDAGGRARRGPRRRRAGLGGGAPALPLRHARGGARARAAAGGPAAGRRSPTPCSRGERMRRRRARAGWSRADAVPDGARLVRPRGDRPRGTAPRRAGGRRSWWTRAWPSGGPRDARRGRRVPGRAGARVHRRRRRGRGDRDPARARPRPRVLERGGGARHVPARARCSASPRSACCARRAPGTFQRARRASARWWSPATWSGTWTASR